MYMMGYIGVLIGSFFITVFGAIVIFSINYPETYLNIIKNSKYIIENMDTTLDDQIIVSPCKQFYTYKDIHYDIAFPIFWILYEQPETGPHHCNNCRDYGTFRGVFLMYCANCASYIYNNNVGYGAIEPGVELIEENNIEKSAWHTYLKTRDLKYIGLPEELEKIDFERENYEYKLKYDTDDNGNIIRCYPDFIEIDNELEEDFDMADNESDTTEPLY
jgi:hypothetical protein